MVVVSRRPQVELTDNAPRGIEVFWTLGGEVDGEFPWHPSRRWRRDPEHVRLTALALDRLPFSGALMAIGQPGHLDPWMIAASVAPLTKRIRFLIAAYPGVTSPTELALKALTLDALSNGRLMLNVVGSNPVTMAAHGIHISKVDRYALLDEYWHTFKSLYGGTPLRPGRFYNIDEPGRFLAVEPTQVPGPPLWGAGESPEGKATVVSFVDVFLPKAGTPQEIAARTNEATQLAAARGRRALRFACSMGVLVRETEDEAWAEADRQLRHTSLDAITGTQSWAAASSADPASLTDRERRCVEAVRAGHLPDARDLEFYPNIWTGPKDRAGIDFMRMGPVPHTMLIGSAEQVAERMREIQALAGVDRFILWAPPFTEEAYRVADLLLPLLPLGDEAAHLSLHLRDLTDPA